MKGTACPLFQQMHSSENTMAGTQVTHWGVSQKTENFLNIQLLADWLNQSWCSRTRTRNPGYMHTAPCQDAEWYTVEGRNTHACTHLPWAHRASLQLSSQQGANIAADKGECSSVNLILKHMHMCSSFKEAHQMKMHKCNFLWHSIFI